jgi:hypothetical protein
LVETTENKGKREKREEEEKGGKELGKLEGTSFVGGGGCRSTATMCEAAASNRGKALIHRTMLVMGYYNQGASKTAEFSIRYSIPHCEHAVTMAMLFSGST